MSSLSDMNGNSKDGGKIWQRVSGYAKDMGHGGHDEWSYANLCDLDFMVNVLVLCTFFMLTFSNKS